jgi:hypothetical protein
VIRLAVASDTRRNAVIESVSVIFCVIVGLDERPNWNDTMDVGVTTEFLTRCSTDSTLVSISFERLSPNDSPSFAVRFVAASLLVRMALTGECFGEPDPPTLITTDCYLVHLTWIAFDGLTADITRQRSLAPSPSRMCRTGE